MAENVGVPIQSYNAANTTKWIFNIPLAHLFNLKSDHIANGNLLDYPLNCRSVTFPEFKLGTTQVSFLNYGFDISTRSNITDKKLTLKFNVSENWLQYLMLLKWFELCDYTRYDYDRNDTVTIKAGDKVLDTMSKSDYAKYQAQSGQNPYYSTQGPMVATNLYLLDNFLNRKVTFQFEGCFLTKLRNVDLDYTKTSDTEIHCEFDMSFYKYNIINHDDDLKEAFDSVKK